MSRQYCWSLMHFDTPRQEDYSNSAERMNLYLQNSIVEAASVSILMTVWKSKSFDHTGVIYAWQNICAIYTTFHMKSVSKYDPWLCFSMWDYWCLPSSRDFERSECRSQCNVWPSATECSYSVHCHHNSYPHQSLLNCNSAPYLWYFSHNASVSRDDKQQRREG